MLFLVMCLAGACLLLTQREKEREKGRRADEVSVNTIVRSACCNAALCILYISCVHRLQPFFKAPRASWFPLAVVLVLVANTFIMFRAPPLAAVVFIAQYIYRNAGSVAAMGLVALAGSAFALQLPHRSSSKTRPLIARKLFHGVALAVSFFFLRNRALTVFAWCGFINVFLLMEILRLHNAFALNDRLCVFLGKVVDERDSDGVFLTPLFLAFGCLIPILLAWAMDLENIVGLSGVLATCVGDSFAAIIPTCCLTAAHPIRPRSPVLDFPRTKFKTYEGLGAFFASYSAVMLALFARDGVFRILLSGLVSGLVEALTDRVDNYWVSIAAFLVVVAIK